MKGECIIIPESMQTEVLDKIHEVHLGIQKFQLRAATIVYWPGMQKDIERVVKQCGICEEHQKSQCAEPLLQHDVRQRPFKKIRRNMFQWNGSDYLIIADYYSKFPIIQQVSGQSTSYAMVKLTKQVFSE